MTEMREEYLKGNNDALIKYLEEVFNVKKEEAENILKEMEAEVLTMHNDKDPVAHRKRVLQQLLTRYSQQMKSSSVMTSFEGVLIHVSNIRDMWAGAKIRIAQQVKDAVKNESTDVLIRNKIISCKVPITMANVDELIEEFLNDGMPMDKRRLHFLTPAVNSQGLPSKTPFTPMRTNPIQNIMGFGSPKDSANPLAFDLQLSGEACNEALTSFVGKPVRFNAMLVQDKNQATYTLRTNKKTNFLLVDDSEVGKAIQTYELNALIEKFMPNVLATVKDVQLQGAKGPAEFKKWIGVKNFCIIKNAVVTRLDFNPSAKGLIKIYVMDENADFRDPEQMCLYPAERGDDIDFIEGTKVAIIARPFVGKDNRDENKWNAIVNAEIFIPYKDFKFEKADVPELSAENVKAREDRLQDML